MGLKGDTVVGRMGGLWARQGVATLLRQLLKSRLGTCKVCPGGETDTSGLDSASNSRSQDAQTTAAFTLTLTLPWQPHFPAHGCCFLLKLELGLFCTSRVPNLCGLFLLSSWSLVLDHKSHWGFVPGLIKH